MLETNSPIRYTKPNGGMPNPQEVRALLLDMRQRWGQAAIMPSARRSSFPPQPEAAKDPQSEKRRIYPANLDLGPLSDPPEMDTEAHLRQVVSIMTTLWWLWRDRPDRYIASDMSIYYPVPSGAGEVKQEKLAFRGPDFFVIFNPIPKPYRRSWVVKNEGNKYPQVILEVLSESTETKDRGAKKAIYQDIFRTPEYFMVDPEKGALEGYRLVDGRYQPILPNDHGHLWSDMLEMAIGVVDVPEHGLKMARFFTATGELVRDPPEVALQAMKEAQDAAVRAGQAEARAEQERARATQQKARAEQAEAQAEQERARAEKAEQEKARLLAKLRELGIDMGND